MEDFKTLVFNYRVENNLTQEELGKILGVRRQAVSTWERGLFLPTKKDEMKHRIILERK